MVADTTRQRHLLLKAGFQPLPLTGKRPAMDQWSKKVDANFAEVNLWETMYPWSTNTGVLTMRAPTLDIDILNTEAADALEELARDMFEDRGYLLVRFGKAPKRAIICRTDEPFKKLATSLITPDGKTDQKVEVLCDGQQVVVFGEHPDTHQPYKWFGGEPGKIKWEELPYISAADALDFIERAAEVLVNDFGFKYPAEIKEPGGNRGGDAGEFHHANWAQLVANVVGGVELHDSLRDLAASLIASGIEATNVTRMLQAVMLASTTPHDERWKNRFDEITRSVVSAAAKYEPEKVALTAEHATAYEAPQEEKIPPRSFMYGGHYIRQSVGATVAPGGTGKTTLSLYEAIEMVAAGLRVWYLSGEDPRVEIDRRIAAHCALHSIKLADLPGKLFVDDKTSFAFFIGSSPKPGSVRFDDISLARFENAIIADKIDVTILDPFISFHAAPENDNGCVDAIIKRIAIITVHTNSNIEISHHVRKPFSGQGALTVDDARGGSAIINAVRSGRVINRLTTAEAEQLKINAENRTRYIRLDRGKRNMAPPDKATWFELVSQPLRNGDDVQALKPWKFPALMDGVSVDDAEYIRGIVRQTPYRTSSQSEDWLGHEIANRLKLDVNVKADVLKIQRIIKVWLGNGVFKKQELYDPESRKKRPFYVAPNYKSDTDNVVPLYPDREDDE
jgi:AAA domain/Bifunctional DNA primase/polymerase, N-terminal